MTDSERPLVVVTEPIHPDAMARLQEEVEAMVAPGWDEEALIGCVGRAQGLIQRGLGGASRRLMAAAPQLKIIARHGAGYDNVDLEAARERGIIVTNTPDATAFSVAEHTLGLILSVSRRIALGDRGLRAGRWGVRSDCWGVDLYGGTLGVVGYGRIGQRVAALARGLGMAVAYADPVPADENPAAPAQRLSLEELLPLADVLTLHVTLNPGTRHLIGARELAQMKPGAILINASRGPVVDQAALIEALHAGRLGGAGLDVFEEEPVQGVSPLCQFDNVVLTPHIASQTPATMRRMAMDAVEEVLRVLSGQPPRYRVA